MSEGLLPYLGRHFVSLWCIHQLVDRDGDPVDSDALSFHISAFVISVRGHWFLVTAGHVFSRIESEIHSAGRRITQCYLMDHWGTGSKYEDPIPFEYYLVPHQQFGDERDFDYGVFALNANHQRLLLANGVEPLDKRAWRDSPEVADRYGIIGVPATTAYAGITAAAGQRTVWSRPACVLLDVHVLKRRPPCMTRRATPRQYGHISIPIAPREDEPVIASAEGMSGSPIIAFKKRGAGTPQVRYWVVGVQSTSHRPSGTISWCPIAPLAEYIDGVIARLGGR